MQPYSEDEDGVCVGGGRGAKSVQERVRESVCVCLPICEGPDL